jgi:hypothetical protein
MFPGRISRVVRRLTEILAELREQKMEQWTRALVTAERLASQKPDRIQRTYQVNYRVESTTTVDEGTEKERRAALVELLRSLKGERHTGTSTWVIKSYIPRAREIAQLLGAPLSKKWDYIGVAEIVTANSHHLGDAKLES